MSKKKVKKKMPQRAPNKNKPNWLPNPKVKLGRGMGTGAGNPRKIETPEILYELFCDFKKWCEENPYQKVAGVSNGVPVYVEQSRPIVFLGFEGYLSARGVVGCDLSSYERQENYLPILAKIKSECRLETVQGAMVGIYNANLTARIEKLSENVDQTTSGKPINSAPVINVYNQTPKLSSHEDEVES